MRGRGEVGKWKAVSGAAGAEQIEGDILKHFNLLILKREISLY